MRETGVHETEKLDQHTTTLTERNILVSTLFPSSIDRIRPQKCSY